jgi:hypothetical protein
LACLEIGEPLLERVALGKPACVVGGSRGGRRMPQCPCIIATGGSSLEHGLARPVGLVEHVQGDAVDQVTAGADVAQPFVAEPHLVAALDAGDRVEEAAGIDAVPRQRRLQTEDAATRVSSWSTTSAIACRAWAPGRERSPARS